MSGGAAALILVNMAPQWRRLPVVAGGSDRTRQDFGKPALANSPGCRTRQISVPLRVVAVSAPADLGG
jgi:hypothetical protein